MKPLLVLARITFVGCLWSIIFIEGVRVIMLENWRFDIFWPPHWLHAWNLWSAGWVIDTPKEWAFILIIATFLPLWLTGWIALSLIPWETAFYKMIMFPINLVRSLFHPIAVVTKTPVVVKKRSYKEIRPTGPRAPIYDYADNSTTPGNSSAARPSPTVSATPKNEAPANNSFIKEKAANARETFSHSLFNLDDEDDDFDLDFGAFEKSDIFSMDNGKNKKAASESDKQNRADQDMAADNKESRKSSYNTRYDEEDDNKPRRSRYDDEGNDAQRRGNRSDHDYSDRGRDNDRHDKDNRRDKRRSRDDDRFDDRRDNNEFREDRRNDNNRGNNRNRQETSSAKNNRDVSGSSIQRHNPVADILLQKGYDIISGITIKNTIIDFAAVSQHKICLCLIDKEPGDWLADEERFNDEEPLWFSESSHRISPVRKIDMARNALALKLNDKNLDFEITPYIIIQIGNIINAEDMFDIWNGLNVEVTRINRGSPKEIKLFSKSIEDADEKLEQTQLETLKKIMRNIA